MLNNFLDNKERVCGYETQTTNIKVLITVQ